MTDAEMIRAVDEVFVETFEIAPEQLKPEAQIFTELGLDSLDLVDLIAAIQKKFGVRVSNDDRVRAIRTLGDLHGYLILLKAEQARPAAVNP